MNASVCYQLNSCESAVKLLSILNLVLKHSLWIIQHLHRSNRPDVLCKKAVLKIFAKFTGKHLR